jgi:chromosome segregation ATPase
MLREQIKLIKKKLKDLADKRELAVKTKKHLQEKIKAQEKSLLTLEEKIENWHAARIQKETASKKHQAELNTSIQAKKKKQFYNLELIKSQKAILPKAIEVAAKKLREKYDGEKGKKLLNNVLVQLGKNK